MITFIRAFSARVRSVWVLSLACTLLALSMPVQTYALPLGSRSLSLGDIAPGANTSHVFTLSYSSPDPIGSVVFEYCTSPLLQFACVAPGGMDASGAVLANQSGEVGYTILNAQTNSIILTRAAAAPTQNPSSYAFSNIINPTGSVGTFYVRISTHIAIDASDAPVDFGAVVNSTTQGVQVSSEVPPILKFCVGLSIDNDCVTAEGSVVDVGEISAGRAAAGSSQMLAATNAEFGLAIAAYGTTMTSGNNVIPALATPTVSAPGNAQFGFNLRQNTNPAVGEEPAGIGIANPAANYDIPNRFVFNSGDVVATSPDATDTRKFTSSYIVNVPPDQTPGVYTATLTYICTATF